MRIFENASFPFMEWSRRAYVVVGVLLLIGVGTMLYNWSQHGSWLNYGVDFRGGTLVQLQFTEPTNVEDIRAAARSTGHADWEITRFGSADEFVVSMRSFEDSPGASVDQQVREALAPSFPDNPFEVTRTEAVGPKVGAELQLRALYAILASCVLIMLYLWVRFEWRFGVAAVLSTVHDILITLGFLALTYTEISLGTVAAFLTIVGYSLNDTIVIFDRIREHLAKPRQGRTMAQILNAAVNDTLPRTILTGASTLVTLLALALFGGAVIRDFAVVLIVGVVIGTLSSIFVAAPLLHVVEARWPRTPRKREQAVPSQSRQRAARSLA